MSSAKSTLAGIAECFLNFTTDPFENITSLIEFCGSCLGADGVTYDRMEGQHLTRVTSWTNSAETGNSVVLSSTSSIRYDKIKMGKNGLFELTQERKSPKSLEVRFGRIIEASGTPVGALSVIFNQKRILSDSDREVIGIVAAAISIEDKRLRAEAEIKDQQLKIVATAKMSALGEMAAGVSHEINNPILAILMRVEQLREILVSTPNSISRLDEVIQITNIVESLVMRISKIVKSLRSFSGDTQDEPFREVSIAQVVEGATEFCSERFNKHQIGLQIECNCLEAKLQCRPIELSRVLLNLLHNSYDAIEGSSEPKWVRISCQILGEKFELSVTDSGHGIPKNLQERLFHPFFSTKDVNRGKGLGLSVARGIIEKHGGTLKLDPISKNTRFVISIPLKQASFDS